MKKRVLLITLLLCAGALWAQPEADWNPEELEFGLVGLNTAAARELYFTNNGTSTLTADVSISGDAFSLPPITPLHFELQPRDSIRPITVIFAPELQIAYSGTLSLTTNDPNHPQIDIPLSGTGGTEPPPPPERFHLLCPINHSLAPLPITFEWEAAGNPADMPIYTLYIRTDSANAEQEVVAFGAGQETHYTVDTLNLPASRDYWWWVSAVWGTEQEVSEEVWIFRTEDAPPPPPRPEFSLLTPANNDTINTVTVLFSWEALEQEGVTYVLWVASPDSLSRDVREFDAGTQTSLEISSDDLGGGFVHVWYVFATIPGYGGVTSNETSRFFLQSQEHYITLGTEPDVAAPLRTEVSVYPNPFNSQTCITLTLSAEEQVKIEVFDLLGREVTRLADGRMPAGRNRVLWNADGPSGMYMLRVQTSSGMATMHRLMFIK